MKLTKSYLKKVISEEIDTVVNEADKAEPSVEEIENVLNTHFQPIRDLLYRIKDDSQYVFSKHFNNSSKYREYLNEIEKYFSNVIDKLQGTE